MADPAAAQPQVVNEEVVVFLNYRTMLESDTVDSANLESWREVLDAFGYTELGRAQFLRDLSLATPNEVMQSLCPYTTKAEWEPVLNKRSVRMEKEVTQMVPVEVLPIAGLKDFLISCAKGAAKLTTVFLSPFTETNSRLLVERCEMSAFIDLIHCYSEREHAHLEALELLNLRPPVIPENVSHRWEKGEQPEPHSVRLVAFEADHIGVKQCLQWGMMPFGISFNCFETAETAGMMHPDTSQDKRLSIDADDGGSSLGVAGDALLLDSGACCVLRDYTSLHYNYLPHIMVPKQ